MAFYENVDRETVSDIWKVGEYVPNVDSNILKDNLDTPTNNFVISMNNADNQNNKNKEIKVEDAGILCAAQI